MSEEISTPRFIGPGCITIASEWASARRSRVRPYRVKYSLDDGNAIFPPRSIWTRSIITTSAPARASSKSDVADTPIDSIPTGISVGGAQIVTFAFSFVRHQMFDRTTLECATSPTIATRRPSNRFFRWRIVSASRRACVGCSCAPSPALTTRVLNCDARKCGTPGEEWRITRKSGDIASRFFAVSSNDSPFSTDVPFAAKFRVSAESHFSAVSNEKRVRVEASKKRFTTILPRRAGTFLISRWPISAIDSAVSRMR